jgi:predicted unusual protein kinase regulating ubiquinone biosynthesis (AarF/ABC1/UbiB family)
MIWNTFSNMKRFPEPFEKARQSLQNALGHELAEVLSQFDEEPLASASFYQVHRTVR